MWPGYWRRCLLYTSNQLYRESLFKSYTLVNRLLSLIEMCIRDSHRSLTQTAGRAARNVNGMVIMYADKITAVSYTHLE